MAQKAVTANPTVVASYMICPAFEFFPNIFQLYRYVALNAVAGQELDLAWFNT